MPKRPGTKSGAKRKSGSKQKRIAEVFIKERIIQSYLQAVPPQIHPPPQNQVTQII